jgi:hypothetical protein
MTMMAYMITMVVLVVLTVLAMYQGFYGKRTRLDNWLFRRDVMRENTKRRKAGGLKALAHLTEEQWEAHMEAFVDYQCSTGNYRDFTGLIPEWLESEGLPPSPFLARPQRQEA